MSTTRDTPWGAAHPIELHPPSVPEKLEGWNLDVISSLVGRGVFESDRFDFKRQVPPRGDDGGKNRLRGTAAAFANSGGGFLVLGVNDERTEPAEQRLIGIAATEDVPERVGALLAAIEPSLEWRHLNPPLRLSDGKFIHVIHVPRSRSAPHGIENDGRWWFPKRTNQGNAAMSRDEIRGAFIDLKQRSATARLIDVELDRVNKLAETLNRDSQRVQGTSLPPSLYLEQYRPQALENALMFVIEEIEQPYPVQCFQDIVSAGRASDLHVSQLGMLRAAADLTESEVAGACWMLSDYARRVMNNVHHFRVAFEAVRDAYLR